MRAFFEPYHVRLDAVPGQADLTKDGIPRAFDGLPDEPTYRYVRGDEKNPDKSAIIKPGVPQVFALRVPEIKPVALPPAAWQPGRRPWVAETYLTIARRKVESAENDLKQATQRLFKANKLSEANKPIQDKTTKANKPTKDKPTTNAEDSKQVKPKPIAREAASFVTEDFKTLDKQRWRLFGGEWVHHPSKLKQPGKLEQKKDGPSRAALRLIVDPPRDFEATVKFTILGGSRWRSVGLSFDASSADPTLDTIAAYHEQHVYVSAHAGGPKVHAAYNDRGKWTYPPAPAMRATPVALNREHSLRVRVRGTLINAALNGQPLIACRTPLVRRDGLMQLTTFDALAVFHEVRISVLPKDALLREPSAANSSPAAAKTDVAPDDVAGAKAVMVAAQAGLDAARANLTSVERRAEASQANGKSDQQAKTVAAVRAERLAAAAKARHGVAVAQLKLLRAAANKKGESEKARKIAQAALDKAESATKTQVKPTDAFTPFVGAKWTPTRFLNSGRDDPAVKFLPESTGRRTALARWITDRRNPLTARVAVNHLWTRHMG
ncbi:MAG: DUF1553 domain-containing protein, partial [Planctomycetales bacterium]